MSAAKICETFVDKGCGYFISLLLAVLGVVITSKHLTFNENRENSIVFMEQYYQIAHDWLEIPFVDI